MARKKKEGRRATGIQAKKGFLYVVQCNTIVKDGVKVSGKKWFATGLEDTPDNVVKACEIRAKLNNKKSSEIVDRNILVKDYVDLFLSRKKRDVCDTTYAGYYHKCCLIKDFYGELKMKDINESNVEIFLDSLFTTRHSQPRTVKDAKVLFGSLVEMAVKDGVLPYNPVREVRINKNLAAEHTKDKINEEEFFSYEEVKTFLDYAEVHELYELYYLTVFFGLRREEVLGLRWSCVNFSDMSIQINHTVTKGTKVNRLNVTKTDASVRTYPLNDIQADMLRKIKSREEKYRKLFGNTYTDNDYIFKHEDGSLYFPDYPSKAFKKLLEKIPELPQSVTFHGLRSSCVSILVHEGYDIKSIQKWVGHADVDTTLRIYAKVKDKDAKREISDGLNNLIQPMKYKGTRTESNSN